MSLHKIMSNYQKTSQLQYKGANSAKVNLMSVTAEYAEITSINTSTSYHSNLGLLTPIEYSPLLIVRLTDISACQSYTDILRIFIAFDNVLYSAYWRNSCRYFPVLHFLSCFLSRPRSGICRRRRSPSSCVRLCGVDVAYRRLSD